MSVYGSVVEEHARHPRNHGPLESPDIRHEDVNPLCGDRVRIELALTSDGSVRAARFQGDLCAIATAASSLLTEMISGMSVAAAADVSEQQVLDALQTNIQPARRRCALLPLEVMRSGVNDWLKR